MKLKAIRITLTEYEIEALGHAIDMFESDYVQNIGGPPSAEAIKLLAALNNVWEKIGKAQSRQIDKHLILLEKFEKFKNS